MLIVGDGIQEGAANIVDFVQHYSGLHFNIAMVEAALYRDSDSSLIVQPRVLVRTEIVQRFVVDGGVYRETALPEVDEQQENLSDQNEENLRYWSGVLRDFSFADINVAVPGPPKGPTLRIRVQDIGVGSQALWFSGFLERSSDTLGCFLARGNQPRAIRIFEVLAGSLAELRNESSGDLEHWQNSDGRPRIGFRRQGDLNFLTESEGSEDSREAVAWMRDHLNLLVSTLHPRLQAMLADER